MQGITADKEAYIEEKMKQFKLVDMRNCYEDIRCCQSRRANSKRY